MLSVNLFVPDSEEALIFYERAFGAVAVQTNFDQAKGERNARFQINGDRFAIADENLTWGSRSALTLGGIPMCIQFFVPDVRAAMERTLSAGAVLGAPSTEEQQIITLPNGTEFCNVVDPFGFYWSLSKEKSEEE